MGMAILNMKCLDRWLQRVGGFFVRVWLYLALVEYILGHVVGWYQQERREMKPFSKAYKRVWWPSFGPVGAVGPQCPTGQPGPVGPHGVP